MAPHPPRGGDVRNALRLSGHTLPEVDHAEDEERGRAERALWRLHELPELSATYEAWARVRFPVGSPPEPVDVYGAYSDVLLPHVRRVLAASDEAAARRTFGLLERLLDDDDQTVRSAVVTEVVYLLAGSADALLIERAQRWAGPNFRAALSGQQQLLASAPKPLLGRVLRWLREVLSRGRLGPSR